jgi:septal ring factor EnvC (AmiA/AmiB activator)
MTMQTFAKSTVLVLALLSFAHGANLISNDKAQTTANANPIRRVVTLLQQMAKKVEAEGKAQGELFEKFMCYCKSSGSELDKSIGDAETKIPQLESEIKEAEAAKVQLDSDLVRHRTERDDAKAAIARATSIREKEAAAFLKESTTDKSNLDALKKALAAIEKGMSGGFLQTNTAAMLRRLSLAMEMSNADRDVLSAFLSEGNSHRYAPASGEIVGILKQMGDTMEKDLAEVIAQEDKAKQDFEGLVAAKEKEIAAATKAIEDKTKRVGEVAIDIVMMKEDLDDTSTALMEDQQFLADLKKNCDTKEKEWAEICKMRQMELIAIADTIKILNDDDALELFKKTVPSASLLQVQESHRQLQDEALKALSKIHGKGFVGMDLIALALKGKKVNFDKVIKMIDDMVALLGKEQTDDDQKKEYCEAQFDFADDKKKGLERSISDTEKAIEDANGMLATLADEIKALSDGIVELDRNVASATETRKEEHASFVEELAANNAAVQILEFAKNRMNKFYNPKLYKPPPKRELSEEERITLNMGGTLAPTNPPGGIAGTGIAFVQINTEAHQHNKKNAGVAPPPPPPEAPAAFKKKGQESGGVLAMMDMIKAELDKEIQEMEFTEKDAQAEYESMVKDAAAKRAADTKSIAEKEAAKAELESQVIAHEDKKAAESAELMATKQYIAELHADCDWLIENYGTRKEARAAEVDALKNAKAVLAGADFSF